MSTKSQQPKIVPKKSLAKGGNKRKRQVASRRRRRVSPAKSLSTENFRLRRSELWSEVEVAAGTHIYRLQFDTETGPAWFKAISKLYEMYQVHYVRIKLVPTAATTNSGGWVAAYNTNPSEKAPNPETRTAEKIAAQYGHASGPIHRGGTVRVPAGALKGYSTNTPLRSDDHGWLFNLELAATGVATQCSFKVYIEYSLTFRNPQLN